MPDPMVDSVGRMEGFDFHADSLRVGLSFRPSPEIVCTGCDPSTEQSAGIGVGSSGKVPIPI